VDPLAEKFPNWNPYNYVMQNPINLIDPTGMEPEDNDNGDETIPSKVVSSQKPGDMYVTSNGGIWQKNNEGGYEPMGFQKVELDGVELVSTKQPQKEVEGEKVISSVEKLNRDVENLNPISRFFYNAFCYNDAYNFAVYADLENKKQQQDFIFLYAATNMENAARMPSGSYSSPSTKVQLATRRSTKVPSSSSTNTTSPSLSTSVVPNNASAPIVRKRYVNISGVDREIIIGRDGGLKYINSRGNVIYLNRDGTKRKR